MKAWEVIEEKGWWNIHTPDRSEAGDRVCLMDAIAAAYEDDADYDLAYKKVCQQIDYAGPVSYNDARGRTKAEVVALLKEMDI